MSDFIPVNEPVFGWREAHYLQECIAAGWISSNGPFVQRLESEMAATCHRLHGIAVSSGTAALEIAVAALGIGAGDEVILPSFTIISCAAAVVRAGATPVVIDCEADTWNMDVSQIEDKITSRTRAIMAVHIFGLPVDMSVLLEIAERHSLYVIEDAAELIGQTYADRPCGSFGQISTTSFYPNKIVTTGEGGMVLTNDTALAARCRQLRNLCFRPDRRFVHEELGWNYRLSNLQAAVGVAQLECLGDHVKKKRWIGARYTSLLAGIKGLQLPLAQTEHAANIYWVFGIVLDGSIAFDAAEAMKRLTHLGIDSRPFFWPMHEQPVFQKMGLFEGLQLSVSERLGRRGLYIPSGLGLTEAQIDRVANALWEIFS
jgi:perosamine synthetase